MIKRKLIATKEFIKEYGLEIAVYGTAAAIVVGAIACADLEDVSEKTTEVYETASHTVIIIPN